ncbi:hypothetical protein C8R44DRAFT_808725 [Mycena epipterygia]|nr:hypothetical protein C8R44DRAFT_808725 [Mycena epipterygia]
MLAVVVVNLAEQVLELTLFGLYAVLFTAVIYLFRHGLLISKNRLNLLESAIVLQFLIITAHWITTIYQTFFCMTGGSRDPKACFLDINAPASVAHIALFVAAGVVTDLLVIHRMYVIWAHQFRVAIAPLVLILVQTAGGAGMVYRFSVFGAGEQAKFVTLALSEDPWVTANLVSSLVISVYCSAMISWKIWRTWLKTRQFNTRVHSGRSLMVCTHSTCLISPDLSI